jgi:hypothetical protein
MSTQARIDEHFKAFREFVQGNWVRLQAETNYPEWFHNWNAEQKRELPLIDYLRQQAENDHAARYDQKHKTRHLNKQLQKQRVKTRYHVDLANGMEKSLEFEVRQLMRRCEQTVLATVGCLPNDAARKQWWTRALAETNRLRQDELFQTALAVKKAVTPGQIEDDEKTPSAAALQPETPPVDPRTGAKRELDVRIVGGRLPERSDARDTFVVPKWSDFRWRTSMPGVLTRSEQFVDACNHKARPEGWTAWSVEHVYDGLRMIFLCYWAWGLRANHDTLGRPPVAADDDFARLLKNHKHSTTNVDASAMVSGIITAMIAFLAVLCDPLLCIKPSRARTVGAAVAKLVAECDIGFDGPTEYRRVLALYNGQEAGLPPVEEVNRVQLLLFQRYDGAVPQFHDLGLASAHYSIEAVHAIEDKQPFAERVKDVDAASSSTERDEIILHRHATWVAALLNLCDTRKTLADGNRMRRNIEFLLSTKEEQNQLLDQMCVHGFDQTLARYDKDRWNAKPFS